MNRKVVDRHSRFMAKVQIQATGCWLWTAARDRDGYGQFGDGGTMIRAHRWAYERFVGPIPHGMEINHLCRVRACVKPEHLEPLTRAEHARRDNTPPEINRRKVACPKGHPYSGINIDGRRICRECQRANERRWRSSRRALSETSR